MDLKTAIEFAVACAERERKKKDPQKAADFAEALAGYAKCRAVAYGEDSTVPLAVRLAAVREYVKAMRRHGRRGAALVDNLKRAVGLFTF